MSRSSVEYFCLTVPKNFVEETFSAVIRKKSASEKVFEKEGRRGEYQGFPLKFFCLRVPKNFLQEPFRVSLISVIENFYAPDGYVTILLSNIFV